MNNSNTQNEKQDTNSREIGEQADQQNSELNDVNKIGTISLFSNGFNFHFKVGKHDVHAWGSAKSGNEKLFLDGDLVSKKWSFTKTSVHRFRLDDVNYEVELRVVSLVTGELHCSLIKDGVHVETQKQVAKYTADKNVAKWRLVLHMLAGGFLGYWVMTLILNYSS